MELNCKTLIIKAAQPIGYRIIPPKPKRRFWTEPDNNVSNFHFKIIQFKPIPNAPIHDLDSAMDALWADVLPTIKSLCREWHGVKVWPVLFVRYESANPLDDAFKSFDAYLPVAHSIFLYNQPELYANRTSPYHAAMLRLAERLLAANAKLIRGKSGLVLAEIYSLNLNVVRFAPLSGSKYTTLPKFLQNKKAIVNVRNVD